MKEIGYDPERDELNPTGSVFCAHGGGYYVPWDQVAAMAHVDSGLALNAQEEPEPAAGLDDLDVREYGVIVSNPNNVDEKMVIVSAFAIDGGAAAKE